MEKERNIEIAKAYGRIVRPWTSLGLEPPSVSVKQIAREAGVSNPATIAGELAPGGIIFSINGNSGSRLVLKDVGGGQVENLKNSAREAAPYKRAVKEANYRSRAPGGGPVVKRRVNKNSLRQKLVQLGKGRLRVGIEAYDEDEERQQERQKTKQRLEMRWVERPPTENDPTVIQAKATLSLIKKLSERRGITDETEILNRLKANIESSHPQTILAIWGPPYERQGYQSVFNNESPEEKMAKSIIDVVSCLNSTIEIQLLILYADYYGTDINGIPRDEIENYGKQIRSRFEGIGEFVCWSELKNENQMDYDNLRDGLPETVLMPNKNEVRKAFIIQRKLGNAVADTQAERLAMKYRKERIIEGVMLRKGFVWKGGPISNIIKLGTALSRSNDEPYELELPKFYASGMPRAVWNTPR